MNYWEVLLIAQKKRGQSGLTIPFLIGCQSARKDLTSNQTIKDLIIDIVHNSKIEVNLRYCFNLFTFILEERNNKNIVYYPTHENKQQDTFSISIMAKDDFGDTLEQVIQQLELRFSEIISNETFSASVKFGDKFTSWEYYSKSDLDFIKQNS